jgi:hypothetical protein
MKTSLKYALLAGAIATLAGFASATPELLITTSWAAQTSANTVIVMGDSSGGVSYNGSLGVWNLTVDTGYTYPLVGSPTAPVLDLSFSAATKSDGAGLLYIAFSQTGFTAPGTATASIGGTTSGALRFAAYGGASNSLVDASSSDMLAILPPSLLDIGYAGVFSGTASGATIAGGAPYSLTDLVTINQSVAGVTSGDAFLSVPDSGTTLMLLGAGLSALGFVGSIRRRFIK